MNPQTRSASPITLLLYLVLASCMGGCAHGEKKLSADARVDRLSEEFIRDYYQFRPIGGVGQGWHRYDGLFILPDKAGLDGEAARLGRFEEALAGVTSETLSPARRHELRLLQGAVINQRLALGRQRVYWHNPMTYAGGAGDAPSIDLTLYLKRDFKPLTARVEDMTAILRKAPAFLALARKNLDPVVPKVFVETAMESATGAASFLSNDVAQAAATVSDPVVRAKFAKANEAAVAAFLDYAEWLKREKLPTADASYALGQENYVAMLKGEWIELTPEQILEAGLRELKMEQARFAEAARLIDPTKPALEVFKSLQNEHPTATGLIPDTRKNLEGIRRFVMEHHIVTIPSKVRARVEETPPPFRPTSFASMDTPGPFEMKATEAYYYITPVETNWPAKQAEEWLTAFNYYALDVTSIHEAYPGHYVQFLALNASRGVSTAAKVFGSYPFVEGWAHYTEQMMLDEGFEQPKDPATGSREDVVRGAKYRMEQSDEALLRLCRLCCSVRLHCQGMTVPEATRFFMDNCYYEEKPAASEATRGTYDPGYLYYSLGKLMILKLRRDWAAQEGSRYTLQRFHDEFLRHGMPPIPLLREIMLKDRKLWKEVL
jgi:uncharacterized protein (DUF885 family)